jgi:hypothetical protein
MNKAEKKYKREKQSVPQMPFNEALKQVWASPPQHKTAKKKKAKRVY